MLFELAKAIHPSCHIHPGCPFHHLYLRAIPLLFRHCCCQRPRGPPNRNYHFHLCCALLESRIQSFFALLAEVALNARIVVRMRRASRPYIYDRYGSSAPWCTRTGVLRVEP